MYYKIGQIAKMMGVSTHLLKHYEKFDLIQPVKSEESNYRYYDLSQCARIIECKKYRNMGFSVQEVAEILAKDSVHIDQVLEERKLAIEREIHQLEVMKQLTMQYQEECARIEENLNQWFVEKMSESYFLPQSRNWEIIEKNTCQHENYNLIDHIPVFKSMLHIYEDEVQAEHRFEWGLHINKSDLDRLVEQEKDTESCHEERYRKLPEQRAFVTYMKTDVPYLENGKLLSNLQQIYTQYTKEPLKELFAIVVKTARIDDKEQQYFKIYIPIIEK